MEIVREDPPPAMPRDTGADWSGMRDAMHAAPHQWHKIGDFSPGIAHWLRKGGVSAFYPEGTEDPEAYMRMHWDITARKISDEPRRSDIYMRWLG